MNQAPDPESRNTPDGTTPKTDGASALLGKLLPELSILGVLLGLWLKLLPPWLGVPVEETVDWLVAVEAATLLFMVALVDLATRLGKPPPWWMGLLLMIGLLAVFPEVIALLVAGWQLGLWVFLPLAWSVLERLRELWTLPGASALEKLRRRALSWGRLVTGTVLFAVSVLILLAQVMLAPTDDHAGAAMGQIALPMLCLFYLIAAIDIWRVHQVNFTARPRSLWPFFDDGSTGCITPDER